MVRALYGLLRAVSKATRCRLRSLADSVGSLDGAFDRLRRSRGWTIRARLPAMRRRRTVHRCRSRPIFTHCPRPSCTFISKARLRPALLLRMAERNRMRLPFAHPDDFKRDVRLPALRRFHQGAAARGRVPAHARGFLRGGGRPRPNARPAERALCGSDLDAAVLPQARLRARPDPRAR